MAENREAKADADLKKTREAKAKEATKKVEEPLAAMDATATVGIWKHSSGGDIAITRVGNNLRIASTEAKAQDLPAEHLLTGGYYDFIGNYNGKDTISWSNGSVWTYQAHIFVGARVG